MHLFASELSPSLRTNTITNAATMGGEELIAEPVDCSAESDGTYDIGLHVAAIFIIGAVSVAGYVLPMLLTAVSRKNSMWASSIAVS